uniref:Nucleolus and neural progenitor protein-like N-terminal domain-containing protein n=1 Tax=Plectus sambesii TaxID=2011161 RepID=A0A914UUW2_9BILA
MGKASINKTAKADRKKKRKRHIDAESTAVVDDNVVTDVHGSLMKKKKKRLQNNAETFDQTISEPKDIAETFDQSSSEPKSVLELVDERLRVQPPFVRQKYQSSEHRRLDLSGLRTVLTRYTATAADDDVAKRERYILRKMRYKMAGPFSHHKFWQAARSISSELEKFVAERPTHSLRQFANGIEILSDDSLNCPSMEHFAFALCKLIRGAILLAKTMEMCSLCARQTVGQLKWGHLVSTNLILLTTAATVFRSAGSKLTFLSTLYDATVKWHSLLTAGRGDGRLLALPEQLASLPAVAEALRLLAIKADGDQRKTHSDFVSEMLRMEETDLTMTSNRFDIEKAAAASNPLTRVSHTDMGLSVSRKSGELSVHRSLLAHIDQWASLKDVKKAYKQVKSASDERSIEVTRTMKRRWESLLVLQRMKQHDRLTNEIAQLRSELVVLINGK